MAHEVASMAFTGQTPWHGLGNQLAPKQPIEVWAEQAGMQWQIERAPVQFQPGNLDIAPTHQYTDKQVLYRSDTLEPLSVVSDRYQVVQPEAILEFYRDLTAISGFELETAGVLKGGRKLWALARTGQSATLAGKDTSLGYVLLATACDGSMATTAQFTSVRVVCNNTLSIATSGNQAGAVKVPHSTTFNANAVKDELGISVSGWDTFMYEMKQLSLRKVSHQETNAFYERLFTTVNKQGQIHRNESGMKSSLSLFQDGRGAHLPSAKGTAFGLLNSITEYVDHTRRARNDDYRLDSAWFGEGAKLKQLALKQSLALAA